MPEDHSPERRPAALIHDGDSPPVPGVFVNRPGESVASGLRDWLRRAHEDMPLRVHLVTAFVGFSGLACLAEDLTMLLRSGTAVRVLIGVAPPDAPHITQPARLNGDRIGHAPIGRLCQMMEQALRAELHHTPLTPARLRQLQDLMIVLSDPRLECRRYERGFLHAKITVIETRTGHHAPGVAAEGSGRIGFPRAVTGSSNLTEPGLRRNQEFNAVIGPQEADAALQAALRWWPRASPFDLAGLIRPLFLAYPPALVFLRMLYEAYGDEVNADSSPCMDLRPFQRDGVAKVRAILAQYRGALIADEVGLGKTYTAGEVARLEIADGNGPVLVVAPASLVKMWRRRMREWGIGCEVISYNRLVHLHEAVCRRGDRWLACGLLILDEAHAIRNPLARRMLAVRSLLKASPNARLIMISATPVNNDGADLFELLALLDRSLEPVWRRARTFTQSREEVRSADGRRLAQVLRAPLHASAHDKAWYFHQLHTRILRRERSFIAAAHPEITDHISFPRVQQIRVDYRLTPSMRRLLADVLDAVGYHRELPAELAAQLTDLRGHASAGIAPLTLAAYQRGHYRWQDADQDTTPLLSLIRATLCKRIESSLAAFAATADHMIATARAVLSDLEAGIVRLPRRRNTHRRDPGRTRIPGLITDADHDDEKLDAILGDVPADKARIEPAGHYDTRRLRRDLLADLSTLEKLAAAARAALPGDPKKKALADLIERAAKDPRGPKIVIFASSRETTHDLGLWLEELIRTDVRFRRLRGRVVNLGCLPAPSHAAAARALEGFAPDTASTQTTEASLPTAEDAYDVLICTDMFAEGVNLQQAALCVNYDLTWNPQRLGQRVGRVDRLGSPHAIATCWTILPDTGLEIVLGIMDILVHKAAIAAETIGAAELFPDSPRKSYTSLLRTWDPPAARPLKNSEPVRDQGWLTAWLGNALRIPAVNDAITTLPYGIGAVHPGTRGGPGVVFCFSVQGSDGRRTAAFAHVHAGTRAGATVLDHDTCLRQARVDPTDWIRRAAAHPAGPPNLILPPLGGYRPMRQADLEMAWSLLETARAAVAAEYGIAALVADERIQLITWMLFTGAPSSATRPTEP